MKVVKRNSSSQEVNFAKIQNRFKNVCNTFNLNLNSTALAMKVIDQIHDDIETNKIDNVCAEQAASMSTVNYDYNKLASALCISQHHKSTTASFLNAMKMLHDFSDACGKKTPLIRSNFYDIVCEHGSEIESMIDYDRDFLIDYFGFKTLERAYLMRIGNNIVERPQHMWMRVALEIHKRDMPQVKQTYDLLSKLMYTHATPTLFNAGTQRPQLSSCYLLEMKDDSIDGIYDTLKECAQISKWAGGIGLHIHNVRGTGSHIRGTNGTSNGIVPMLRVFNTTARYVDQGGGKRNGSFAIYLEPWHVDICEFLDAKKNHGDEEMKARDLFYALWVSDYFMKCVHENDYWYLFCPDITPGLSDCFGDKFEELYLKYVSEGKFKKKMKARELWFKILDSQMETGTPYLLYKDSANKKSNQQNLGVIKSSNLCCEIIEYSSPTETAVCNLASIALSKFVKTNKLFDYDKLHDVTKHITRSLNNLIDVNYYPNEKTRRSNQLHRPIGIGVQGLADTFLLMDVAFCSETAKDINKLIFETIYHASMEASNEIAISRCVPMQTAQTSYKQHLHVAVDDLYKTVELLDSESTPVKLCNPINNEIINLSFDAAGAYSTFTNSPLSHGKFQFDLWDVTPSGRYDWDKLRQSVMKFGVRNSLLVAPMPTASTSQILGNNECFEPVTSNIYTRRTLAGEFVVVNKYLMADLIELNMWDENIKNNIIENKGSVQQITNLPPHIKDKYKTVWEIPMKHFIDMAADRGVYICQSQSLNLWIEDPNYKNLTAMHFYSWKKGLKTGIYYLRRKAKHQPQQFTITPKQTTPSNDEVCETCSA